MKLNDNFDFLRTLNGLPMTSLHLFRQYELLMLRSEETSSELDPVFAPEAQRMRQSHIRITAA
ncbi:MAG TPA: hypothetical protein VI479_20925 [Blastocatellia bacterium]